MDNSFSNKSQAELRKWNQGRIDEFKRLQKFNNSCLKRFQPDGKLHHLLTSPPLDSIISDITRINRDVRILLRRIELYPSKEKSLHKDSGKLSKLRSYCQETSRMLDNYSNRWTDIMQKINLALTILDEHDEG